MGIKNTIIAITVICQMWGAAAVSDPKADWQLATNKQFDHPDNMMFDRTKVETSKGEAETATDDECD